VFKYDVNAMATYMSLAGTGDFTASQPQTDDEENPTIVYYDVTENLWVASVNGTKYATFAAAYSAAPSEGAALVVKVGSEGFTPTFPDGSGNEVAKTFASIEFINTDDAEISIATKAGNKALTAATWISPAKATLTLGASQTVTSITAATLILPANVTLTLASGTVFGPSGSPTVSTLSGAGTVYLTGAFPGNSLLSLVQKSAWTGVLSLYNVQGGDSKIALSQYGNANSTVRFNYVLCGVYPEFSNFSGTLELDGWGWYLKGSDYASGASILISAALKGSGALTIEAAGTGKQDVKLTGDISQYTGHISFGSTSTARVCFGASHSAGAAASRCIIVPAGKDMQLPAGAKLTAPTGFVIQGGLDALGTLAVEGNESIYGSGVVKTHGVANAVKAAGTWTGTYRIAGGASGALVLSKFGSNANSTIEIVEDIDGAYPATADSHAPSIISTLKLSADWTVSDGWSDVNEVTTFAKLTGEGNLTVNGKSGGNAGDIYYTITRLEGYSGTLGGARGRFKVGTIVAAVEPTAGTKLVKLASGTREFLDLDSTVVMYNNAVVENITLEQKSDGIYVASPAIDPDQGTTVDVDTTASEEDQRAEAQTKANAMDVAKTADASAVDQATWNGYFTKTVEKVDDKWVATAALNPAAVLPVDDTVEEAKLTDMLESVTAAALDDKTPTAVPTKAGLYYWIAGATEVGATTYTPGTAALGDGTKKALTMPTLDDEDGKAFYKVCVGVEAPVAE
jgi:hypothetical protein